MNDHPIRLSVTDDLQRSRLTVFFRALLVIPHYFVLVLWAIAAYVVLLINWFATLIAGQSPEGLHNFLANFLRYATRVGGYYYLLANPFPPFGASGAYPIDLEVDPPQPQSRLVTFFRAILVIPAMIVASVLGALLGIIGFIGWFVCLFTAKMPQGMEELGAFCLRYQQQTYAYYMLLTARYPSFSAGAKEQIGAPTPAA